MFEFNWPTLPDTTDGLSAAEIRTLAEAVRAERRRGGSQRLTAEQADEWAQMGLVAKRLFDVATEVAAEEQAEADAAAALEAEATAATEAATAEQATTAATSEEQAAAEAPRELALVGAPAGTLSVVTRQIEVVGPNNGRWLGTGVGGKGRDANFASMEELAETIFERGKTVTAGSKEKVYVARQQANFGERTDYALEDNPFLNLDRFAFRNEAELKAAMCAPLTPLYDLSCDNATRRPVAMGLPNFRSPERGGFSVYPSPSLSDITGGYGQWTSEMDFDTDAIKDECQTITCSTPVDYLIYGIYRCLTVKNLVNMTFPEIVAAYLNRLEARWARFAEALLLDQMGTASETVDVPSQGYGANVSLKRMILNYLGLYQEMERWDVPVMDAWMPRWLLWALRMDELSRKRTNGTRPTAPSEEEINASFRDVGVEPHWYMDAPSWATPLPNLTTAGTLNFFPNSVEILIHRRGKFALMDRGELQVGVTGNNIYRKEDDLRRNQFTFFFESFEGLIDTDSCPAHLLQVSGLCYNGYQIADFAIGCEGGDNPGHGS